MKRQIAAAAIAATFALAACGGDDKGGGGSGGGGGDNGYPKSAETTFMKSCTQQSNEAYCKCVFDSISAKIPYDEFKKLEKSIGSPNQAPAGSKEALVTAIKDCRDKL